MKAQPGRLYALLVADRVHQIFSAEQMPEWHDGLHVIDITDTSPAPRGGDHYIDGVFVPAGELPEEKKRAIDAQRDAARFAPVEFKGHFFQADPASLSLLNFQVADLAAGGTLEPDFAWWDVDNMMVPMTADDLRALHHLVRNRNYAAMRAARAAKDALLKQPFL